MKFYSHKAGWAKQPSRKVHSFPAQLILSQENPLLTCDSNHEVRQPEGCSVVPVGQKFCLARLWNRRNDVGFLPIREPAAGGPSTKSAHNTCSRSSCTLSRTYDPDGPSSIRFEAIGEDYGNHYFSRASQRWRLAVLFSHSCQRVRSLDAASKTVRLPGQQDDCQIADDSRVIARGNRMLFSRWMCWCRSCSNSCRPA